MPPTTLNSEEPVYASSTLYTPHSFNPTLKIHRFEYSQANISFS